MNLCFNSKVDNSGKMEEVKTKDEKTNGSAENSPLMNAYVNKKDSSQSDVFVLPYAEPMR